MSIEAMKQALEALKKARRKILTTEECHATITFLDKALKQEQEPTSGFFSRDAMKEHSDFHPQPKQEQGEPATIEEIRKAMIFGIALYTTPQPREWVDLTGEELETLLRENRLLALGAIWAVADKLKEKNT